jgi:hypothetical protein
MKYQTGEEIRKGDKVLLNGKKGEIEFVADQLTGDSVIDWHVKDEGPGVMVFEPESIGHLFIHEPENAEDLNFVARA